MNMPVNTVIAVITATEISGTSGTRPSAQPARAGRISSGSNHSISEAKAAATVPTITPESTSEIGSMPPPLPRPKYSVTASANKAPTVAGKIAPPISIHGPPMAAIQYAAATHA